MNKKSQKEMLRYYVAIVGIFLLLMMGIVIILTKMKSYDSEISKISDIVSELQSEMQTYNQNVAQQQLANSNSQSSKNSEVSETLPDATNEKVKHPRETATPQPNKLNETVLAKTEGPQVKLQPTAADQKYTMIGTLCSNILNMGYVSENVEIRDDIPKGVFPNVTLAPITMPLETATPQPSIPKEGEEEKTKETATPEPDLEKNPEKVSESETVDSTEEPQQTATPTPNISKVSPKEVKQEGKANPKGLRIKILKKTDIYEEYSKDLMDVDYSTLMKTLNSREEVTVLKEQGYGWLKVKTDDGKIGYIYYLHTDYVEKLGRGIVSSQKSKRVKRATVIAKKKGAKLRKTPGMAGDVVATLENDSYIEILSTNELLEDEENFWFEVKTLKGEIGFLYGENVRVSMIVDEDVVKEDTSKMEVETSKKKTESIDGNTTSELEKIAMSKAAKQSTMLVASKKEIVTDNAAKTEVEDSKKESVTDNTAKTEVEDEQKETVTEGTAKAEVENKEKETVTDNAAKTEVESSKEESENDVTTASQLELQKKAINKIVEQASIRVQREKEEKEKLKKKKELRRKRKKQEEKDKKIIEEFYSNLNANTTDMSKNLGISKRTFVKMFKSMPYDYVGFFKQNAATMWKEAKKRDINEFLMVGIYAWESGWGRCQANTNNHSGQKKADGTFYSYETPQKEISVLAKCLSRDYLKEGGKYHSGKTLTAIGHLYCNDSWGGCISDCIKMVMQSYLN